MLRWTAQALVATLAAGLLVSCSRDVAPPPVLDATVYRGLGAWVDVFDFAPAYQDEGQDPVVGPDDVEVLAAHGVETLFLQAARREVSGGIVDGVGEILAEARRADIRVVGWYLPTFDDVDTDLVNLEKVRDFEHDGHRFDGIALDIEWRESVPDDDERSRRLVELSRALREVVGDEAVGAIVPPPLLLEEVNPDNWPRFPWRALSDLYDVWLPMSYWTLRTESSGLRDGYGYTVENVERLRENLGDSDAPVHPIGGIADEAAEAAYGGFVTAAEEAGAVGLSMYDYRTTTGGGWARLRRAEMAS